MSSPIKSIIKNLSDRRIRYDLPKQRSFTVMPKGNKYDTAVIEGDVFSMFLESREAEALIQGVIRGVIEISYSIEAAYKVSFVDNRQMSMVASLAGRYENWLESARNAEESKEESKEEPKEELKDESKEESKEEEPKEESKEEEEPKEELKDESKEEELKDESKEEELKDESKEEPEEESNTNADSPEQAPEPSSDEQGSVTEDADQNPDVPVPDNAQPKKRSARKLKVQ